MHSVGTALGINVAPFLCRHYGLCDVLPGTAWCCIPLRLVLILFAYSGRKER